MNTQDTQDQHEQLDPPPIRRPRRPPPDDVDQYVELTDQQREQYDAWRYVRSIQHYWRQRERALRPPPMLLLMRLVLVIRRQWQRFVDDVRRQ